MIEDYTSPFEKKVFERKHLDTKDDIADIRLNPEERALVEKLKEIWNVDSVSKVFKISLGIAQNVVFGVVGEKSMRYLCEERRVRRRVLNKDKKE